MNKPRFLKKRNKVKNLLKKQTNPYVVTSTTTGDSYVDTDLSGE